MRIGDLAHKAGVSVRTLRYYEQRGLLTPLRAQSGQRVYQIQDVARLHQILSLKRLGLSLDRIEDLFCQGTASLVPLLQMQEERLSEQLRQIRAARDLTTALLVEVRAGREPDITQFCNLIKLGEEQMTEMEKWQKVYDKYYSEEEQAMWAEAKQAIPPDQQRHAEQEWPRVIARVEALLGSDPASSEAQAVLKEWDALLAPLYQFDPGLLVGADKLYANMDDWPEDGPEPPFSQAVMDFITAARKVGAT